MIKRSERNYEQLCNSLRSIGPSMFEAEALGLSAMYETQTIRVPKPFKVWRISVPGRVITLLSSHCSFIKVVVHSSIAWLQIRTELILLITVRIITFWWLIHHYGIHRIWLLKRQPGKKWTILFFVGIETMNMATELLNLPFTDLSLNWEESLLKCTKLENLTRDLGLMSTTPLAGEFLWILSANAVSICTGHR